jgi:hypothetical protein
MWLVWLRKLFWVSFAITKFQFEKPSMGSGSPVERVTQPCSVVPGLVTGQKTCSSLSCHAVDHHSSGWRKPEILCASHLFPHTSVTNFFREPVRQFSAKWPRIYLSPTNVLCRHKCQMQPPTELQAGAALLCAMGLIAGNASKLIFWMLDSQGSGFFSLFALASLFMCFTLSFTPRPINLIEVKQLAGVICLSWIPTMSTHWLTPSQDPSQEHLEEPSRDSHHSLINGT